MQFIIGPHDIPFLRGVSTLSKYQNITGGFGGGSSQISHLAVTYAAVNALAILGTKEAYDIIDRLVHVRNMDKPNLVR